MNTYYIDGYRIAARSLAQARFAARELAAAAAPREYEEETERELRCFECGVRVASLRADSRCWRCTSGEEFE